MCGDSKEFGANAFFLLLTEFLFPYASTLLYFFYASTYPLILGNSPYSKLLLRYSFFIEFESRKNHLARSQKRVTSMKLHRFLFLGYRVNIILAWSWLAKFIISPKKGASRMSQKLKAAPLRDAVVKAIEKKAMKERKQRIDKGRRRRKRPFEDALCGTSGFSGNILY